jgi:hypothetical protein
MTRQLRVPHLEEALYAGVTNGLTVLAGSRPSLQTYRQAEHAQYLR